MSPWVILLAIAPYIPWILLGIGLFLIFSIVFGTIFLLKFVSIGLIFIGAILILFRPGTATTTIGISMIALSVFMLWNPLDLETLSVASIGQPSFTYTHEMGDEPLNIGAMSFVPSVTGYTCPYNSASVEYPGTSEECWESSISFGDKEYEISPGEKIELNEYLTVSMQPRVRAVWNEDLQRYMIDRYEGKYFFMMRDLNIESTVIDYPEIVGLGDDATALISVNTPMTSFDKNHAGAFVRFKHGMLQRGESFTAQVMEVKEGINQYQVSLDSSELGSAEMKFQPYVIIDADQPYRIWQRPPTELEYEVVRDVVEYDIAPEPPWYMKFWLWILGWFN